jgi:uncharacterized protein
VLCLFDSSALVKLVVDEDESDVAARLWDEADVVLASRLAYPEVRAALAAAERAERLTATSRRRAADSFGQFWRTIRVAEVTAHVAESAAELADRLVLGGADALHLASAQLLSDAGDVVVVTWDARLQRAAGATGLAVAPASSR